MKSTFFLLSISALLMLSVLALITMTTTTVYAQEQNPNASEIGNCSNDVQLFTSPDRTPAEPCYPIHSQNTPLNDDETGAQWLAQPYPDSHDNGATQYPGVAHFNYDQGEPANSECGQIRGNNND